MAGRNADRSMKTASIGKLLLLVEVARQCAEGDLTGTTLLGQDPELRVADSGIWQHLHVEDFFHGYARAFTKIGKERGWRPMTRASFDPQLGPQGAMLIGEPDSLLIENVAVNPDAQGTGLGRQLMEFAEQEAARRRLTRVRLYTHEVMTESQAVYARLGYREDQRTTEDAYRRIFMSKDLPG